MPLLEVVTTNCADAILKIDSSLRGKFHDVNITAYLIRVFPEIRSKSVQAFCWIQSLQACRLQTLRELTFGALTHTVQIS